MFISCKHSTPQGIADFPFDLENPGSGRPDNLGFKIGLRYACLDVVTMGLVIITAYKFVFKVPGAILESVGDCLNDF